MVMMPSSMSLGYVFLPRPYKSFKGKGNNLSTISRFLNIVIPSGFFISEAIFAKKSVGAIPIEFGK